MGTETFDTDQAKFGDPTETITQNMSDLIAGETEILSPDELEAQAAGEGINSRGPRGEVGSPKTDKQKRINKMARAARKINRGNR